MIPSRGNFYKATLYRRNINANDYEPYPNSDFNCKVATHLEIKSFMLTDGLFNPNSGIFIMSNDLKTMPKINDKIYFLGRLWLVSTIGYYITENRLLNGKDLNMEEIMKRCPKGLRLE